MSCEGCEKEIEGTESFYCDECEKQICPHCSDNVDDYTYCQDCLDAIYSYD